MHLLRKNMIRSPSGSKGKHNGKKKTIHFVWRKGNFIFLLNILLLESMKSGKKILTTYTLQISFRKEVRIKTQAKAIIGKGIVNVNFMLEKLQRLQLIFIFNYVRLWGWRSGYCLPREHRSKLIEEVNSQCEFVKAKDQWVVVQPIRTCLLLCIYQVCRVLHHFWWGTYFKRTTHLEGYSDHIQNQRMVCCNSGRSSKNIKKKSSNLVFCFPRSYHFQSFKRNIFVR